MPNRVTPPPMENDPRRIPDANNGRPVAAGDARNEGPPYDRTHGDADPGHVRREEDVDNQDKALPSESNLAIILAAVAVVLAVLAVIFDAADWDVLATVLAVSGVVTGLIATAIAWNDARGSPVVPGICLAAAVAVLVIIFLDLLGAEAKTRNLRDGGAATVVAPSTVDNSAIPADPANIVEGTPQQRDIASDAVKTTPQQ